ncbi:MAG: M48 family metalloprotease [Thalassobaculales bacterium]
MRIVIARLLAVAIAIMAMTLYTPGAQAQGRSISLIRDAETEALVADYAAPLFAAAGLDPAAVDIVIVNDRNFNAFVAGGQRLFVNTGLLVQSRDPLKVIGVLAHETGHIAGGHLARMREVMRDATTMHILATILAGAAMVAGGRGATGTGGDPDVTQRFLLQYSRVQEQAADQAGVNLLEATGQSARGMMETFEYLQGQELLTTGRQSPYARSHPLTADRIEFIRGHLERSRFTSVPAPPELVRRQHRIIGKLRGFIDPMGRTLQAYKPDDPSEEARIARAVALHRNAAHDEALALVDGLIAQFPEDPYYRELKGQFLFESGRPGPAVAAYREAVRLLPGAPLLRIGLAQALLAGEGEAAAREALTQLSEATRRETDYGLAWRLLAIAHGRLGDIGSAALALAEQALSEGRRGDAVQQAKRAQQLLATGTPGWLRAQDIETTGRARRS